MIGMLCVARHPRCWNHCRWNHWIMVVVLLLGCSSLSASGAERSAAPTGPSSSAAAPGTPETRPSPGHPTTEHTAGQAAEPHSIPPIPPVSPDAPPEAGTSTVISIIKETVVHWDEDAPELVEADGYVIRHREQSIQQTVDLPAVGPVPPRITLRVTVTPIESTIDGQLRPNDLWPRLGHISVVPNGENDPDAEEIEILRFVTGYGAKGVFLQDVTALGPLLHGRTTLRAHLSTYSERPGWRISVAILYTADEAGARRPLLARSLFADAHLTTRDNRLTSTLVVPAGTATPRIRILTTGHATDGLGANEFISATHILRINDREVARWRPWCEAGAGLRSQNPYSGRWTIDGRVLYSSDLDRSGWHPGLVVEPTLIPLPELTPGRHRIELEIVGIRPPDAEPTSMKTPDHGYWATSAILLADELWPDPGS